jgi:hypothetical protein
LNHEKHPDLSGGRLIELVAGVVGGHAIAAAAKEYSFASLGHTIAGALGGALPQSRSLVTRPVDAEGYR